jgi:hypothetical protein
MNKKAYLTPTSQVITVETTSLLQPSITVVGGDTNIKLWTEEEGTNPVPGTADSRAFNSVWDEWDF